MSMGSDYPCRQILHLSCLYCGCRDEVSGFNVQDISLYFAAAAPSFF